MGPDLPTGAPATQSAAASSPSPPSLPHNACLPMWRSSRRPWPPSVSVCCCEEVGSQGFSAGKCSRQGVSGGWGKGAPKAETDFGQSDFGHPYWPTLTNSDFGQADFGPNWCFSILAFISKKKKTEQQEEKMHRRTNTLRGPEGWGPELLGPRTVCPELLGPEG